MFLKETACGTEYTAPSGVVQSPSFPSPYTNNLNCVYIITVLTTHRITLTFLHFNLESGFDFVEVRETCFDSLKSYIQYRSDF